MIRWLDTFEILLSYYDNYCSNKSYYIIVLLFSILTEFLCRTNQMAVSDNACVVVHVFRHDYIYLCNYYLCYSQQENYINRCINLRLKDLITKNV